jgi:hypothetical protein
VVTPPGILRELADGASRELNQWGGARELLQALCREGSFLGELSQAWRAALLISLDEVAEAEALEAEWRRAEEMASLMDGEVSQVPGFEEFRRTILDPDN